MYLTKSAKIHINTARRKRDKIGVSMNRTISFAILETYLKGLRIKKRETKRERTRRVETLLNIDFPTYSSYESGPFGGRIFLVWDIEIIRLPAVSVVPSPMEAG